MRKAKKTFKGRRREEEEKPSLYFLRRSTQQHVFRALLAWLHPLPGRTRSTNVVIMAKQLYEMGPIFTILRKQAREKKQHHP